jgi:hypothetical protein
LTGDAQYSSLGGVGVKSLTSLDGHQSPLVTVRHAGATDAPGI